MENNNNKIIKIAFKLEIRKNLVEEPQAWDIYFA